MIKISLQQLRVFAAVAKHQHVNNAATALFMSQSAVSAALSELESQLNHSLFDRVGKTIIINANGKALLPAVQNILDRTQALPQFLSQDNVAGELVIGASSTIGTYLLPEYIAKFKNQFPQIQIHLTTSNSEAISKGVLNLEYDLGLIESDLQLPGLVRKHWKNDQLKLVAAPSKQLNARKKTSLEDLTTMQWILREKGSGTREAFERAFNEIFVPQVLLEFNNAEAIKRALCNSQAISLISEYAVENELQRGELVELIVKDLKINRQLFFITHADRYQSPLMKHFFSFLNESL